MNMSELTPQERDRICEEALAEFIHSHVWGTPHTEFRVNIKPVLTSINSTVGNIFLNGSVITLPTVKDAYYIWAIASENFAIGLTLPTQEWVDSATILNEYRTYLDMYCVTGQMFHKCSVFLRYNSTRSMILIAVRKNMVKKCCTERNLENVYLTIYYDSDLFHPINITSFYCESAKSKFEYQRWIDDYLLTLDNPAWGIMYLDGIEVTDINNPPIPEVGCYIDLIRDENITHNFNVDITNSNEDPTYFSDVDKCWKQLIHIPKALNENNYIIAHPTCDFFVRKHTDKIYGRYLHRSTYQTKAPKAVCQVTHNDFAIPLYVLDAYRDYLNTQEISIHVVIRLHADNNEFNFNNLYTLTSSKNFINLLYSNKHSDEDIINFLIGKHKSSALIPWWKATENESSNYVKMILNPPLLSDENNFYEYADALGFYQSLAIIYKRVKDSVVNNDNERTFKYNLSALQVGKNYLPIVYLNNKLLNKDNYEYKIENNYCSIFIKDNILTKKNQEVTVILFLNGNNDIYHLTPHTEQLSFNINYEEADVYKLITLSSKESIKGINSNLHSYYQLIAPGSNQYAIQDRDGQSVLVFNNEAVSNNDQFLVLNKNCSYRLKLDISKYIETGETIAIPLESSATDLTKCPILNFKNILVHLNNDYLIRDIDYFINDVRNNIGDIVLKELVIQTMDHFNKDGNDVLEVILNVANIEDSSSGFVVDNIITDATPANLYFPELSTLHIDNRIERHITNKGTFIQIPDKYNKGDIFEIQTDVPLFARKYLESFIKDTDTERLKIMNEYFGKDYTSSLPRVILNKKHRIYSVFLNTILWNLTNNKISLVDDPDESRFQEQIKPWLYLKDLDLCFRNLDQRFVDYYPQYVNYEISPVLKHLLDRLIANFMPKNIDPTLDVVYN